MAIRDSLLPEYDHELATTRRLLERVPDADLSWKPHERSMTLGELAGHIANLPFWCRMTLETTVLELDSLGDDVRVSPPASREGLLRDFDTKRDGARTALAATSDSELLTPWTLKKGGHELFTMPKISAIRTFVMNHLIHHRGQLSVYLRLRNVPVPAMYGPTADEQ